MKCPKTEDNYSALVLTNCSPVTNSNLNLYDKVKCVKDVKKVETNQKSHTMKMKWRNLKQKRWRRKQISAYLNIRRQCIHWMWKKVMNAWSNENIMLGLPQLHLIIIIIHCRCIFWTGELMQCRHQVHIWNCQFQLFWASFTSKWIYGTQQTARADTRPITE